MKRRPPGGAYCEALRWAIEQLREANHMDDLLQRLRKRLAAREGESEWRAAKTVKARVA